MAALRALLIDDEPMAVQRLELSLAEVGGVEVVGIARNGEAALQMASLHNPDIVFLDVEMPKLDGIQVADALRQKGDVDIVFVTAFNRFAVDAFTLGATDYLLKPLRTDRLKEAINRARRRRNVISAAVREGAQRDDELWIPHRDGHVKISVCDIRRIEAAKDYAIIYTGLKTYILRTTMSDLERRLDPEQIIRVHRSAFIHVNTIVRTEVKGRRIARLYTDDGSSVEVSASYAPSVHERLMGNGRGTET